MIECTRREMYLHEIYMYIGRAIVPCGIKMADNLRHVMHKQIGTQRDFLRVEREKERARASLLISFQRSFRFSANLLSRLADLLDRNYILSTRSLSAE